MSNIKVGDVVEVISTDLFGSAIYEGAVGVVTDVVVSYEVEILFYKNSSIEVYQYVPYDGWEEYVKVVNTSNDGVGDNK
ncbi:hypothetical protein Mithridates_00125 [Acinetobacter phage Mithridates]|nr:hypothetical protein Mithridates_00125 [Acinetobacter phage Mithridates]